MMTLGYIVSQEQIKRKSEKKRIGGLRIDYSAFKSEMLIFYLQLYRLTRTIPVQVGKGRGHLPASATYLTSLRAP